MRYLYFIFLLPFLLQAETMWQADTPKPFAITIHIPSLQINLDSLIEIDASFNYPVSYELNAEQLIEQFTWSANPLSPKVKIKSVSKTQTQNEEIFSYNLQLQLIPLKTGLLELSFLNVSFLPKKETDKPLIVFTPVFSFQILSSSLPPSTQPMNYASLIPLEPEFPLKLSEKNRQLFIDNPQVVLKEKEHIQQVLNKHTFPWIQLIILLVCIAIGWFIYLNRDQLPKFEFQLKTPLSAKQHLEKKLQLLQFQTSIEQSSIAAYYNELGSILLEALQLRLKDQPKEMTTFEINQRLKNETTFTLSQKKDLLLFLTEIDQVKFANKGSSPEAAQQFFQQIKVFIQEAILS